MSRTSKRELRRLVDAYIGQQGIAWGSAKNAGGHIVLHEGDGAGGNWFAVTLSCEELRSFADKFLRSVRNIDLVPAVRELIDDEALELRATITSLRCELLARSMVPSSLAPYSNSTALVVAKSTALVLVKGGAS